MRRGFGRVWIPRKHWGIESPPCLPHEDRRNGTTQTPFTMARRPIVWHIGAGAP
jgi:hypothetical protein